MNNETCNCCHGAECPTHPPAAVNTDRELFREGDFYSPSIHVTKDGNIGMNVGGRVIVKSINDWHSLAKPVGHSADLKQKFDVSPDICGFSDSIYHQ